MFITGCAGIILTVTLLVIFLALYSGTTNQARKYVVVFAIFLNLLFEGWVFSHAFFKIELTSTKDFLRHQYVYTYLSCFRLISGLLEWVSLSLRCDLSARSVGVAPLTFCNCAGFSLFGRFASSIILLQTAPIDLIKVGCK